MRAGIFFCGVVLGVAAFMLLNDLGAKPLELYDEGTYARVVAESFDRGDFLTFTYNGAVFFDKPPLYFWLAGVATYFSGDQVWGIRFPAALAGVGVVGMVMLLAYSWSRSPWVAGAAGSLLLLIPPFIVAAREARLDVVVTLCILLALYVVQRRWWIWFGLAVGLAVLAKSAIAVFAVAPALIYIRTKGFWVGAAVATAVVLPWHLYEWVRHGSEFWVSYLGYHVFERYATNVFYDPALQTDYVARLSEQTPVVLGLFFLSLVVVATLWPDLHKQHRMVLAVPLSMVVLMVAIFFSSQTRALSYLVPLYPFVVLVIVLSGSYAVQYGRDKLGHETIQNDRRVA